MRKKIVALGLCLTMNITVPPSYVSASALEKKFNSIPTNYSVIPFEKEIGTNADTMHYSKIKNRKYIQTIKNTIAYLSSMWALSDHYTVTEGVSKTSSLSVSATKGSFTKAKISLTGQFSTSVTRSFSVGISIPANPQRNSKLAIQEEKKVYSCDLYDVTNYGYTETERKTGSGYVYEPSDLYLVVVYQ